MNASFIALDQSDSGPDTTTDVHVITTIGNAVTSLDGSVVPDQSFSTSVTLSAGDTIDFAVGYGNGSYYNDSTGLKADVTATPEPGTFALLGIGGILIGFARRSSKRRNA